jgi:hypothetical protein
MDQLKIVLEHKFWILAGLAILLPPIGWWAATGNIAEETDGRNKKIEAAEKAISGVKEVPNNKWIDGAKEIGKELNASVAESQQHLFEHQTPVMRFPQYVQDALDKCHLKYRQDGSTSTDPKVQKNFLAAKQFFVDCYADDWKNAVAVVKPFKVTTGEGLVLLPLEITGSSTEMPLITRHNEVETAWRGTLGFTATQMYDVEEDVWFLKALMQAIAKVNEGATELGNARIKRVLQVVLRGGDESDLVTRRTAKAGGTGAPATPKTSGSMNLGGNTRGGGGGGGGQSSFKAPKALDPDDVFGADGSKDAAAAATGGKKDSSGPVELRRWAQSTQKYNKRGFVMKLVMDEREIPTLLTALTFSPFPIEIRQVEHQAYTGRTGSEFSQINSALTESAEGTEQTPEQKQQQQRIIDGLRMAFNVNYLAEVTVAGTMTIYSEPSAAASSGTAKSGATQPATTSAPSSAAAAKGKAAPGKSASKTGASASGATKTPATPLGKAASATPATKSGASTAKPSSSKTPPPAGKSSTNGK